LKGTFSGELIQITSSFQAGLFGGVWTYRHICYKKWAKNLHNLSTCNDQRSAHRSRNTKFGVLQSSKYLNSLDLWQLFNWGYEHPTDLTAFPV